MIAKKIDATAFGYFVPEDITSSVPALCDDTKYHW